MLKVFEKITETFGSCFEDRPGTIWVEEYFTEPAELKTDSGIILAKSKNQAENFVDQRPILVRALTSYTEDGESVVKTGDILIVGQLSVNWFNSYMDVVFNPGSRIGFMNTVDVIRRYEGEKVHDEIVKLLREATRAEQAS